MRYLILLLCLFPIIGQAKGNKIKGKIIETTEKGEKIPLPGASVFWKNTNHGTATNSNGEFEINEDSNSNTIVIQFVGYKTKEVKYKTGTTNLLISLDPNIELNEVVVSKRKAGTVIDRVNPIQSQSITGAELCKAACCNLAESFETNASVDVAYADAATGAKSIKLLGLTGKYIEMMTEKTPNFKGLASVYGMSYVPGPWMHSIQVSKGVGSVVNGYESITGQINIEYQKPQLAPKFYLNLFGNSMGMTELNAISGIRIKKNLSTAFLVHAQDNDKEIDHNHDNFLDDPMVKQYNVINRWYWKPKNGPSTQFGVKLIDEERIGGQKGYDESKPKDINNAFRINIDTKRYEFFAKSGYVFPNDNDKSIAIITNFTTHEQKSFYGLRNYTANEDYFYANLLFQSYIGNLNHKYTAGLSYIYDKFDDNLSQNGENLNTDRTEKVAGAYIEYTYTPSDDITLQTGLRYDNHSIYDGFVTPRLHFRYKFAEKSTLRIAAGSGRRTSNTIAENSYLLASNRKFTLAKDLKQEKAWNYGLSLTQEFNLFSRNFTLSTDFYRTSFQNQIITDLDYSLREVRFYNLEGDSWANNYQAELKFSPFERFDITAAMRFSDVKAKINNKFQDVPYVNKHKGLVSLSYATRMNIWQFDFTSQFNGSMRIPSTANNPTEHQRRDKAPNYTQLSAQVTKRFRHWEIYAGAENIGDYVQKKPIIAAEDPFSEYFDASMIWGPIQERKFYLGLRFTLDYK
ncbi:MAG: TonB-dependent receptor [Marinifilaceae bacterium]|jgi:hypothetical protein|nr:TonB-dependent receptor [Marinifilaceae bacterium]